MRGWHREGLQALRKCWGAEGQRFSTSFTTEPWRKRGDSVRGEASDSLGENYVPQAGLEATGGTHALVRHGGGGKPHQISGSIQTGTRPEGTAALGPTRTPGL